MFHIHKYAILEPSPKVAQRQYSVKIASELNRIGLRSPLD